MIQRVPVTDRLARATRDRPWGHPAALHPKVMPRPARCPPQGRPPRCARSARERAIGAMGMCRGRPRVPVRAALPPKRAYLVTALCLGVNPSGQGGGSEGSCGRQGRDAGLIGRGSARYQG